MKEDERDFLLTRAEVEARFGLSKRYLELASVNMQGPRVVRIGRSVRYRVSDIRDWIEARLEQGR